jgi:hypothetical protein
MANTKIPSELIADNAVGITQLNVSDGSDGQVLTTNGSGTLSFSTVSGGGGGLSGGTTVYMHNAWQNQTINLNTVTKINMDAVDFGNSENAYNTTNKEYTGINANNQAMFLASIYKNGSEVLQQGDPWKPATAPGSVRFQVRIMKVLNLAQNDVIDFRARMAHYSGSATTVDIGRGDIYSTGTFMHILKLQ